MTRSLLSRRVALLGAVAALGGCSAVSALNTAAEPLDTYDLLPAIGSQSGPRTIRTMLVVRPEAPAAISSDRIMIKPDAASIKYLPDARWSDELPLLIQSLLVRSIAGTDRIGYVGRSDGGPIPDTALLVRIDTFNVDVLPDDTFRVAVDMTLTALDDGDQRVIATQLFATTALAASDTPAAIVAAFQVVLNELLPRMADWAVLRA